MARTLKITDEQTSEAAQATFLSQGFGASTAEIAEKAGISEASILKQFSTEKNLSIRAMRISNPPQWALLMGESIGRDFKDNLKMIEIEMIRLEIDWHALI